MKSDGWQGILDEDEEIVWQGRPDGKLRLRAKNIVISVFGLFFLGFSVFWIIMASGATSATGSGSGTGAGGLAMGLFGLPFVLIGLYLVVGIHWFDALSRRKTYYTLTSRRAFIATELLGKRLKSYPVGRSTELDYRPGSPGSIYFATETRRSKNGTYHVPIGFEFIADAEAVYQKFRDIQKAAA